VLAAITAPVFPAEMNASDLSCFWSPRPMAMEELGLLRIAWSGFSPIPTTSGASTICTRARSSVGCWMSAASMAAVRPTSCMTKLGGNSASACATP
jgi:hypothetical protein